MDEVKNATYLEDSYINRIRYYMEEGSNSNLTKKKRISYRLKATKIFISALMNEKKKEEERVKGLNNPLSVINYEKIKGTIKKIQERYKEASNRIISSIK